MKKLPTTFRHIVALCTSCMYTLCAQAQTGACTLCGKALLLLKKKENGGARRDRTVDLYAASVALSQLSYGPITIGNITKSGANLAMSPSYCQPYNLNPREDKL